MLHSNLLTQIDAVAREGSIRKASQILNVSASSINRRIIQLEDDIGSPIFVRHSNGVRLTSAGEVVIAHIRQTLREATRMSSRIEEMRGLSGAHVRVASMQGLVEGIVPRAIKAFKDRYPAIFVTVSSRTVSQVEHDLQTGDADIGLAYAVPGEVGMTASHAFGTRLGVVVSPTHPLADRSDLRLSEIQGFQMAVADESLTIHSLIAAAFDRSGLSFKPSFLSNSTGFLKYLARSDQALTFLSRIDVEEDLREGWLRYIPILGNELRNHELRLAHKRGGLLNPAAAVLEEHLKQAFAAIGQV